jgi:hypothetical protein
MPTAAGASTDVVSRADVANVSSSEANGISAGSRTETDVVHYRYEKKYTVPVPE